MQADAAKISLYSANIRRIKRVPNEIVNYKSDLAPTRTASLLDVFEKPGFPCQLNYGEPAR